MHILALAIAFSVSVASAQAQTSPHDKVERITKALGFERQMEATQSMMLENWLAQTNLMWDEMRKAGRTETEIEQLSKYWAASLERAVRSWDPKKAAHIYAEGIASEMSEAELAAAERYYTSPEGQKSFAVVYSSLLRMQEYVVSSINAQLQKEMAAFIKQTQR